MIKRLLAPFALLAVLLFRPVEAYAATYGICPYVQGCVQPRAPGRELPSGNVEQGA